MHCSFEDHTKFDGLYLETAETLFFFFCTMADSQGHHLSSWVFVFPRCFHFQVKLRWWLCNKRQETFPKMHWCGDNDLQWHRVWIAWAPNIFIPSQVFVEEVCLGVGYCTFVVARVSETPEINYLEACPDNCDNIKNAVVCTCCKKISLALL